MRKFVVIWIALLILAGAVGVFAGSTIQEREHQNDGIRTFACFFESAILASKHQTAEQKIQAVHFFNGLTNKLNVASCPAIPEKGGK